MKRRLAATLLFSVAACGGSEQVPVAGDYVLDSEQFAKSFQEQFEIPLDDATMHALRNAAMELTLNEDYTFTCRQRVADESHEFTGTWTLVRGRITLNQTHEDGEEKEDTLAGPWENGQIRAVERTPEGVSALLVLNRKGS